MRSKRPPCVQRVDRIVGPDGSPMRNPDSPPQARQQLDTSAEATQFASGTQSGSRCGPPEHPGDRAALDLAAIPRAAILFDADRRIIDVNPLAEALAGRTRSQL